MDDQEKGILSLRNLLKVLSFLCVIFYFCPSFLVSCSGEKIKLSGINITTGIKVDTGFGTQDVTDPHIAVLLCLLIPIAILVISFIVKRSTGMSITIAALALVDLIIWFIVRSGVKEAANRAMCEFKSTGVFVFNVIVLVLIIAVGIAALIMKVNLAADIRYAFSGKALSSSPGVRPATRSHAKTVGAGQPVTYCENCGSPIEAGKKFCTSCGTPAPVAASPVAPESAAPVNRFCPYCGAKLEENSAFCTTCGKKLEVMRL